MSPRDRKTTGGQTGAFHRCPQSQTALSCLRHVCRGVSNTPHGPSLGTQGQQEPFPPGHKQLCCSHKKPPYSSPSNWKASKPQPKGDMFPSPSPCFASCCAQERGEGSPLYQLSRQHQPQPAPSSLLLGDKGVAVPASSSPTPLGHRSLCSAPCAAGHQRQTSQEGQSHGGSPTSPPQGAEEQLDHPFLARGHGYGQISGGGAFRVADPRHTNTTSAAARGEEDAVGKKRNHKA